MDYDVSAVVSVWVDEPGRRLDLIQDRAFTCIYCAYPFLCTDT